MKLLKGVIFIILLSFSCLSQAEMENEYSNESSFSTAKERVYKLEANYREKIDELMKKIEDNQEILSEIKIKLFRIQNKLQTIKSNDADILKKIILYFSQSVNQAIHRHQEEAKNKIKKKQNQIKSVYYTSFAGGNQKKIQQLLQLTKNTEVNAVTIDIKEVDGYVGFDMSAYNFSTIQPISNHRIKDIRSLIKTLHENDIYVIGRIVVFKDKLLSQRRPDLAIKWSDRTTTWYDYKGNNYLDPYAKEVWDYTIELSQAAYDVGFDEINFDYVRFPTDGAISKTYYPFAHKVENKNPKWGKIMVLDEFSNYITSQLKEKHPELILSADIFGLVTLWDLFKIGQSLESFALYFDYLGPMVYPSHYSRGMLGYANPDNHPYPIIKHGLQSSIQKIETLNQEIQAAQKAGTPLKLKGAFYAKKDVSKMKPIPKEKIRPWIQGFSCTRCKGYTPYNRTKFRQQIKAIESVGLDGWWVWNSASNYYFDWYSLEK